MNVSGRNRPGVGRGHTKPLRLLKRVGFGCRWEQHFFPMSEADKWVADPKYVHYPSTAAPSMYPLPTRQDTSWHVYLEAAGGSGWNEP